MGRGGRGRAAAHPGAGRHYARGGSHPPSGKASWASRGEPTVVELVSGTRIGGRGVVVMAGRLA
ncbi:MAG TPA: hypothetical protein VF006_16655 [Longimicrobium sp.]